MTTTISKRDISRFFHYFMIKPEAEEYSAHYSADPTQSDIQSILQEYKPLISACMQAHPYFSIFLLIPRSVLPSANPALADLFDQLREVLFELMIPRPRMRRTAREEFSEIMQKLDKLYRIFRYVLDDIPRDNQLSVLGYYLDRLASIIRPLVLTVPQQVRLSRQQQQQQLPPKPSTPVRGISQQDRKIAIQNRFMQRSR